MARVKRSMMKNKRRNKILKLAKGFRNARSTKYKQAKQGVIRAGQHAFAHRRAKKRVMRQRWQVKINYAVRDLAGLSYSKFIDQVTKAGIAVDRKIMAEMVENDMDAFARFVSAVTGSKVEAKAVETAKESIAEATEEETVAPSESDDLTKVEGIGPKIAETLTNAGVATFAELAKKSSDEIQGIIADVRGSHDSETWAKQAEMARDGRWDELKTWQDEMDGGKA